MNAPHDAAAQAAMHTADAIAQACARIAPTWPLDRFIAVNPYWGWVGRPVAEAAAHLGLLAGTRLTADRAWFRGRWQAGALQRAQLEAALAISGSPLGIDTLLAALEGPDVPPARLPLLADLRDTLPGGPPGMPWSERVTHQVSQHCAAFFDTAQAQWQPARDEGLFASWRRQLAADRSLPWRQGRGWLQQRLAALPAGDDPAALVGQLLDGLAVPPAARTDYLSALLLSINGWAAWCAYERWQARLEGRSDDRIVELLAIRLVWDALLRDDAPAGRLDSAWAGAWQHLDAQVAQRQAAQQVDWLLQLALEIAHQRPLAEGLVAAPAPAADALPKAQAVFCIDVRSEVFRRALEAVDPGVHTRGFAGFFGLPIAYSPLGSALTRPQLPGLLAPAQTVSDEPVAAEGAALGQHLAGRRRQALLWRQRWSAWRSRPASAFSFVETLGLGFGAALLARSLPSADAPVPRWEDAGLGAAATALRPRLALAHDDAEALTGAAAMAAGILGAMGLRGGFAPILLLAGHGSTTANNPHAAGLDCGACGGQTGEVNARVLADLLNTPAVREALRGHGIDIPPTTHALPGLHDTTTDELRLFDLDAVPASHRAAVAQLQATLAEAGARARAERASSLGLAAVAAEPEALARAVQQRARDWAQVRPEWGLADNAAFVVAPRGRTRHLALRGRAFLHDYDHRADPTRAVLELIMTAPMVVTNWINLQYHASTVDNRRYGSGNKLLHNVVGGNLGVFEGNGGDLRIGLPLQSLHDGHVLRHTPLRLSVFIEAPAEAIDGIVARHAVVRELVENGWLHLFRIDPERPLVERRLRDGWHREAGADV